MPNVPHFPDPAHQELYESLLDHLEQLADSFLLGQTAADFAQTVLTNFGTLQQTVATQAGQIATLQSQVATLQTQVTALTPPSPTPTV